MMSLTFGLFTQVSGSGPLGPLVSCVANRNSETEIYNQLTRTFSFKSAITWHTWTGGIGSLNHSIVDQIIL